MAAPTVAQHKSNFGTSVTSVTVTLGSNVTAGNMLVIFVGTIRASVDTINTPTMTGETFTKITNASNAGSGSFGQVALYLTNTNAGNTAAGGHSALTVTISSTADDLHVHVIEVSGQSSSPQDATGNTESTTLSVSTSTSTSTANDLILAFFYDNVNNQTLSAGSGYSIVEQSNNTTGGDVGLSVSKTVSSTGTQTATASGNAGDTCEQSIIAIAGTGAFQPDEDFWAAAPPITTPPIYNLAQLIAMGTNQYDEVMVPLFTGQPDEDYWTVWLIQPSVSNVTLFS